MNKDHLKDFESVALDLEVKVGDLVSFYEDKAQELSGDFQPSVNVYYKAYLLTMKEFIIDGDYGIMNYDTDNV